jgi:hypothetical protein
MFGINAMNYTENTEPIKAEADKSPEYDKFTEFAKKLLAVPKPEVQPKAIKVVKQKPTKA